MVNESGINPGPLFPSLSPFPSPRLSPGPSPCLLSCPVLKNVYTVKSAMGITPWFTPGLRSRMAPILPVGQASACPARSSPSDEVMAEMVLNRLPPTLKLRRDKEACPTGSISNPRERLAYFNRVDLFLERDN